jgi:glutamyl-tRNA(Gln) amidotransferase subunit E
MRHVEFLSDAEYAEMGFKSGLEIHQQLDTRQKLFCRCPVGLTDAEPDMRILRHMRPTLSELGEYDGTALMEFKTRKEVIYELYSDLTCTYEMDDTPPFPLNQEALDIAIEIALLLNCRIVDEVHVTRKQYLDGSIPTGFQRTTVVGVEGWIPYKGRRIHIALLTLEEDACREVSDVGHTITFKTDRLSTPLVEVITYPDIQTPLEVPEVNWLLGDLLRATGKVRRGIGTVRQDVNVSVTGGDRCEIKGVPRIEYHAALTHFEALRQRSLLDLRARLAGSGISPETLQVNRETVTDILHKTGSPPIRRELDAGGIVIAQCLQGCAGLFNHTTQPGLTFADEVAGRIRVVACIDRMPNLLHSDNPEAGGLTSSEWRALREKLGAGKDDLVAVVFGGPMDALTAADEVEIRIREACLGVPRETRQHRPDGRTDFERILPGPDRMYPDTDTPPTAVSPERISAIAARLPERPREREERYLSMGLKPQPARDLSRSPLARIFDAVVEEIRLPKPFLASVLLQYAGNRFGLGSSDGDARAEHWLAALRLLQERKISRQTLPRLLESIPDFPGKTVEDIAVERGLTCVKDEEVEAACDAVLQSWKPLTGQKRKTAVRWLTGRVMRSVNKRFSGKEVASSIEERLQAMRFADE